MKKTILIYSSIIQVLLILLITMLLFWGIEVISINFTKQENIVKKSITAGELNASEKPYILCQPVLTTGFYWLMVQDENKDKSPEYVMIAGADPMSEMKVRYEFSVAPNKFIFYVIEKKECFSKYYGEYIEYVVDSEWDILYPVQSGRAFRLPSRNITQSDMQNKK
jgi:hypothetical protein